MKWLSFSLNLCSQTHWKFSKVWKICKEPVQSYPWGSRREDKAIPQKDGSVTVMSSSFNPMDCSMPGFPVLHYLLEFVQTHVHWVSDAIEPSYPLLPPSPPALNLSQHQGLFQCVSSSNQVAKVLELQHQPSNEYSGLISFRIDWFELLAVQGTLKDLLKWWF